MTIQGKLSAMRTSSSQASKATAEKSLCDNDGTTHLADYTYVGLDRIVAASAAQPGTELTYIKLSGEPNGDGGDPYTGWDRFSRLIDQRWIATGTGTALERTQYGYDQAGNRLWRANLAAESASASQDEYYTCDGLYQLERLQRGTLNGGRTGISGTPTWEEDYTFDPTGNWNNYLTKVSGTTSLNQNRTHNKDNALATLAGSSAYVAVNAVGNMTTAPQPGSWSSAYTLTCDAWNRLVKVASGAGTVAACAYDGLSRRTTKVISGVTRDCYYTPQWQIVEERVGGSGSADRQFVWGLRAYDDLVLRDYGSQRMYAMHDYFNCTAIADTTRTVQERYGYNGFGQANFMTANFGSLGGSAHGWETLFANYRWDGETGLYQARYRYQHPALGRWLSRDPIYEPRGYSNLFNGYSSRNGRIHDPIGQLGRSNIYGFIANRPITLLDSSGLLDCDQILQIIANSKGNYNAAIQSAIDAQNEITTLLNAEELKTTLLEISSTLAVSEMVAGGVVIEYSSSLIEVYITTPAACSSTAIVGEGESVLTSAYVAVPSGLGRTTEEVHWNKWNIDKRLDKDLQAAEQQLVAALAAEQVSMATWQSALNAFQSQGCSN